MIMSSNKMNRLLGQDYLNSSYKRFICARMLPGNFEPLHNLKHMETNLVRLYIKKPDDKYFLQDLFDKESLWNNEDTCSYLKEMLKIGIIINQSLTPSTLLDYRKNRGWEWDFAYQQIHGKFFRLRHSLYATPNEIAISDSIKCFRLNDLFAAWLDGISGMDLEEEENRVTNK
jgi:hypothetical protein